MPARFAPFNPGLNQNPAQALRTVTSIAAEVCGVKQQKGRIAVGFDADLLAVQGDPLTDAAALHRIRAVYRGGALVTPHAGPTKWCPVL